MFSSRWQFKALNTNADTQVLSSSTLRYGILLSTDNTTPIYLSNDLMTATAQGFPFASAAGLLWMDRTHFGDTVAADLHVWSVAASKIIGYLEVMACSCEELRLLTDALGDPPHGPLFSERGKASANPLHYGQKRRMY